SAFLASLLTTTYFLPLHDALPIYNGINQYGVSRRLYHSGMYVAMAMGVICTTVMMFGARLMDNGDPNMIPVIRSLAWAILIIPRSEEKTSELQSRFDIVCSLLLET